MAKNSRIQLLVSAKDQATKVFRRVQARIKSFTSSVFSLKTGLIGLGTAVGGTALAKSFLDAARETENYQARLKILLGSQKEGNRLFKEMSDYASQVPFEYNEIMGAATQLAGVMKGGVDEIGKWMPLIGDLAAASGLGIQQTTDQVARMLSSGAASADLFQERGINAMLGFQAGVSYSAEETRKKLMSEWQKTDSRFRGATGEMAKTWDGLMSMLSDAWFQFRTMVMESGVFDGLKSGIQGVLDKINELRKSGKLADLARGFGENIMSGIKNVLGALPGIVRGAIKAAEMLVLAFTGFKQIKGIFEIFFKQVQIWSLEFVNQLRLIAIRFIEAVPGLSKGQRKDATAPIWNDIGQTFDRIDAKGGLAEQLEKAKVSLGKIQIEQDQTIAKMEEAGKSAAEAVKEVADGALKGMEAAHARAAAASKKSADSQIEDIYRIRDAYNEMNKAKLGGGGSFSTYNAESFSDTIEAEADR